jgi:hypothetical protein
MAYTYSCLKEKAAGQLKHRIKNNGIIIFALVKEMLQILR